MGVSAPARRSEPVGIVRAQQSDQPGVVGGEVIDQLYALVAAQPGLITDAYQPSPAQPFGAHGNARAARILEPGSFTAIKFAIATSAADPQTRKKVAAPHIVVNDGRLSGQISAWSASWNNSYFNQGSPKPDGSRPGLTTPVGGTHDAKTHAFVLTWASQIVGGSFNGVSGFGIGKALRVAQRLVTHPR